MEESGAVFNEQAVQSASPATVIFTIGDMKFTAGDLAARMSKMRAVMNEGPSAGDSASRETITSEYFSDMLLSREAAKRGLDRDPEYLKRIKDARETYLAGDYIRVRQQAATSVSRRRRSARMYDLFKNSRYYTTVTVNGKKERRTLRSTGSGMTSKAACGCRNGLWAGTPG